MRTATASLLVLAFTACAFASASAQLRASMDLGGGEVGFGAVPASAATMSGAVDYQRWWLAANAAGSLYRFENSSVSSSFARAELMLRPPRRPGFTGELAALGTATDHHSYYRAQRLEARVGAAWIGNVAEASVGYGLARVIHDRTSLTANRIQLEAQGMIGAATFTLAATRAAFRDVMTVERDTTYFVAGFPFRGRYDAQVGVSRSYVDAEAGVQWQMRRATLGLGLGARRGDATTASESWQRFDVVMPFNSNVALMATGGRTPGVPEERIPSGAFAIFGVRLSLASDVPQLLAPPGVGDGTRLVTLDVGGGNRSITIIGLVGKRIEIMADFTDWKPVDLTAIGDRVWHVTLPIAPGLHRINIRIDGREWMPPPGIPVTADEFMGTVGVLLIE